VDTWKIYVESFLEESGASKDPVARMMAEQLALVQHAIGRLNVRAATQQTPAGVAAYHVAIARLMAEYRRTALALQTFLKGRIRKKAKKHRPKAKSSPALRTVKKPQKSQRNKLRSRNRLKKYFAKHEPSLA
jgi:hypothetical protein